MMLRRYDKVLEVYARNSRLTLTKTSWQVERHGEAGGHYVLRREVGDGFLERQKDIDLAVGSFLQ